MASLPPVPSPPPLPAAFESAASLAAAVRPLWLGDRGGTPDYVLQGAFAVTDAQGRLSAWAGDPEFSAFLRSSAKPFQVLAFLRRGLASSLSLGAAEIACACASHSGEERHVAAARRILSAAGVSEQALLCGTHAPFPGRDAEAPLPPRSPLRNNCSGKHAAMLATCRHEGWPEESYPERAHPLQLENARTLAEFAGLPVESLVVAEDNCTVPTWALPLRSAARALARLREPTGLPADLADAAQSAVTAMTTAPGMVGGLGRLDTALMEVTNGRLLAKTGANGYHAVSQAAVGGRPALGFALKLAGAEGDAMKAPVVIASLVAAGLLTPDEAQLVPGHAASLRGCRGAEVGRGRFVGEVQRA